MENRLDIKWRMKLKNNHTLLLFLILLTLLSCSSIDTQKFDNSLLIGSNQKPSFKEIYNELNNYENSDSNFVLYSLFYHNSPGPKNKLPQLVTQYLFIPKVKYFKKLDITEKYFEIYKYTNHQNKVRLRNAEYKEYDNLVLKIKSIILKDKIECDGYSSSNPSLGYDLYFNMFENEIHENSVSNDFLSKNNPYSYYCLSSYLRTILFEKEYNQYIGRK